MYHRIPKAFIILLFLHVVHGKAISSCNQTPYPQICHHYLNANLQTLNDIKTETLASFRELTLEATAKKALEANRLVSSLKSGAFGERGKTAWRDCSELYDNTVELLNRSVAESKNDVNYFDTQTWLSASLANIQTCEDGFVELEIASHLSSFPSVVANFSKLLSNSLAVHKSLNEQTLGRRSLLSFPEWISASERRLLQAGGAASKADIVVAKDGTGNYETISEAVEEVKSRHGGKRVVVYVKSGVYKENVEIGRDVKNLMIVGDGIDATIVTGSRNNQDGSTTFRSATFGISGDGFIGQDVTFENTAGPENHQAVALRSSSDRSVFYRCAFKGYQDTLYVHSNRQFYRDCNIYGTVDFIFGDAVAVLQSCNILLRKPMNGQKNTVTAQARSDPSENTGIVIQNSRISASPELRAAPGSVESFLGRPWRKFSRTVIVKSVIDGAIGPEGWLPWSGGFALDTLYYGEYMNSGAGAATGGRVGWKGFRVLTSAAEAGKFTVGNFLAGGSWIPATGVPFANGL